MELLADVMYQTLQVPTFQSHPIWTWEIGMKLILAVLVRASLQLPTTGPFPISTPEVPTTGNDSAVDLTATVTFRWKFPTSKMARCRKQQQRWWNQVMPMHVVFFFFFSNYDVEKPKAVPVMGEKDLIFGILEKFINFKQMDHFIPLYYAANGTICTGM